MVVVTAASLAFAVFQPIQVLPRLRLAPGYTLHDPSGAAVTSEAGRGVITLYTFVPLGCGAPCDHVDETMREVGERVRAEVDLAGAPFRMVTIVTDDAPTSAAVATAAAGAGAGAGVGGGTGDGAEWLWLTGSARQIETIVGLGFRRRVDPEHFVPTYAIVDGWGMIRGEYRYRTLASDADKLVRHIDILGGELRHRSGITGLAYDAAHLFQCYP